MKPDDISRRMRSYLHQITKMIDEPKATAKGLVLRGPLATLQSPVQSTAAIGHLAEEGLFLGPNSHLSPTPAVQQPIGGKLAYGERKVGSAHYIEAGGPAVVRHERPDRTQMNRGRKSELLRLP